jgi:hypothetical protein
MTDMIDKMRKKQAARQPGEPKPREIVGYEKDVLHSCGHAEDFPLFAGEKPDYLAGRKAKFMRKRCPECRRKAQESEEAALAERRKVIGNRRPDMGRCPDGTEIKMKYKEGVGWTGSFEANGRKVEGTRGGIVPFVRMLHEKFLAEESAAKEGS